MKRNPQSKLQSRFAIVFTFPFLAGIVFLLTGLFSLDDKLLDTNFSFDLTTVLYFALIYLASISILVWRRIITTGLPKHRFKRIASIFGHLIILFLSSFLFVKGLKMNLNYWLKSTNDQQIEVVVTDKDISHGKGTDHYIRFNSKVGALNHKVSRKNFDSFAIGDTFKAHVNEGFFHGYFLNKPLISTE